MDEKLFIGALRFVGDDTNKGETVCHGELVDSATASVPLVGLER